MVHPLFSPEVKADGSTEDTPRGLRFLEHVATARPSRRALRHFTPEQIWEIISNANILALKASVFEYLTPPIKF